MATIRPTTAEAMEKVNGFSGEGAKQFGEEFMTTCREFCDQHSIVPNAVPIECAADDSKPANVGAHLPLAQLYSQLSPEHKMLLLNVNPLSARISYDRVVVNKLSPVSEAKAPRVITDDCRE